MEKARIEFLIQRKPRLRGLKTLSVMAVQHIRRMRGGAQGQLMLCADENLYVVKFRNNPQHMRVLANEYLAGKLAQALGLATPEVAVVEVSPWLVEHTPELEMDFGKRRERCLSGLQFGSRFVGGLMPGQVVDYLPEERMSEVRNLQEFAGILALDKWTGNANGRQAVFSRRQREKHYKAVFIDFGYCFHAGDWCFEDLALRGVYYRNDVYRGVMGWEAFEPWLSRVETISEQVVWDAAGEIPAEWYGGDLGEMESLVERLLARRGRVRELIEDFRKYSREPFPNWGKSGATLQEAVALDWRWGTMPQRVM